MVVTVCADSEREVGGSRDPSRCSRPSTRGIGSRTKLATTTLLAATLAVGCSQVLGFNDPRLASGDDSGASDGSTSDGSAGSDGSVVDTQVGSGVVALWVFTTNGAFQGTFGMPNGGRTGADTKCDDMYKSAFMMTRQCTKVHAVIQVDNTNDTLDRMAGNFQIPPGVPVLRATDATRVANQWDDVVNRTVQLLAPVSTSTTNLYFWSGRGVSANRHCNSWQSNDPALLGDAGIATQVSSWLSQTSFTCDSITPHLLCVCW